MHFGSLSPSTAEPWSLRVILASMQKLLAVLPRSLSPIGVKRPLVMLCQHVD
jgi:hypothetical protein